jgi:curved DNA-binding protein CbpA
MTKKYSKEPIKNIDYIIDYYSILGITDQDNFAEALKKAYHKLSKQYHPDLFEHASEEVKNDIKNKYQLIQEANKILANTDTKSLYDQKLAEFKKNKPDLISMKGIPILDLNREIFDLDYLLSGLEWDFQDNMKSKVQKLSGYNEAVFNLIEKQYEQNPKDEAIRVAYLDQLAHKKACLDFEEIYAWQELGVLNAKDPRVMNELDHVKRIESKIQSLKNETKQLINLRLLSITEKPLLMYDGTEVTDNLENKSLGFLEEKTLEQIEKKTKALLVAAQLKQDHLVKMMKLRKYEQIATAQDNSVEVLLHDNEKILTSLYCDPKADNIVKMNSQYQYVLLDDIRNKPFSRNTFLLEFNVELDLTLQLLNFITDYYNESL